MYCEHFQLTEPPFRLTPDPQFLYASKQHSRAKAYMESTIWLADGFVVITGEIGSGKTTLIESFLSELPDDVILAQINQTQLTPVEFLQSLLVEFGYSPYEMKKVELLSKVKEYMVAQYTEGKTLLLVVDEAQNLSRRVLEEVRMLSGIESQKEKLLRIILAGQPELASKLDAPALEQLSQRVRLRFHLGTLTKRETRGYIEHRLEVAGAKHRRIFDDGAFDLIFRYCGGVPRLINLLCDTAMLTAFAENTTKVTAELIEAAVEELQWVPYEERKRSKAVDAASEPQAAEPTKTRCAMLELRLRNKKVSEYELKEGRLVIGRTADNDIQIPSKFISRHHAQITSDAARSVLEDLNSTNGMFIESKRVRHRELADGDVIQLGEHSLHYRDMRTITGEHEQAQLATDDTVDGTDYRATHVMEDSGAPVPDFRSTRSFDEKVPIGESGTFESADEDATDSPTGKRDATDAQNSSTDPDEADQSVVDDTSAAQAKRPGNASTDDDADAADSQSSDAADVDADDDDDGDDDAGEEAAAADEASSNDSAECPEEAAPDCESGELDSADDERSDDDESEQGEHNSSDKAARSSSKRKKAADDTKVKVPARAKSAGRARSRKAPRSKRRTRVAKETAD